jgi:signal transduction histidine kinase
MKSAQRIEAELESESLIDEWVDDTPELSKGSPAQRRGVAPLARLSWQFRLLVATTLLGCLALLLFIRTIASTPVLDEAIHLESNGTLSLVREGAAPVGIVAAQDLLGRPLALDPAHAERSARWIVDDARRARHVASHEALARAVARGPITFALADGSEVIAKPRPLGVARLGVMFWLMTALALALYLVVMVAYLSRPNLRNVLYALSALPQVGNLLFVAVESTHTLHLPGFVHWNFAARSALDVISVTAVAHSASVHPRELPWARWLGPVLWAIGIPVAAALLLLNVSHAWWITQAIYVVFGTVVIRQFVWSYRHDPHPLTLVLQRFAIVALGVLALLTVALGVSGRGGDAVVGGDLPAVGTLVWAVFIATLFVALPFLSRSQPIMREFSILAGISTMATALDLLFIAVFSLGPFASLSIALFLSLMAYAGVRQWILNHMLQTNVLTTERMFEKLYRIARDVEDEPRRLPDQLSALLREVYDPLEVLPLQRTIDHSHVVGNGAALLVPVPPLATTTTRAVALRYAHRGKRLFTPEDARLTDRIVEQLARVVAFDQAVERGRTEERMRIAQDLHDDIGARLLTLMYKAPNTEVEEYIRHTLHELKTLTRGLAASDHRLSHAVAEWKADIAQRLELAGCDLGWAVSYDKDIKLNVVQWSAITRILRELVTNTIAHAHAHHVQINGTFANGRLVLVVGDDGIGRNPQAWSHGLGLGGVRKRVKLLEGQVQWTERDPRGIAVTVDVALDGPEAS